MIKAIFFDLDGTLVDTLPLYIKSYGAALREQGFLYSETEIVDTCFGKTESVICENLQIPNKVDEFSATYFAAVQTHFCEGKLFSRVLDCLELAKTKQIKLGIISFAYNWYVDGMIDELKLRQSFEIILGHDDVVNPKPNPEAISLACKKLGLDPRETVMIGDSAGDISMGKAAGSKTILFHPPNYSEYYNLDWLLTSQPDKVVSSYAEIVEIVKQIDQT